MNGFDKFCAVLGSILGIILVILGLLGLFMGCNAYFTLPPVLGVLPAFVGWGIFRSVWVAWKVPRAGAVQAQGFEVIASRPTGVKFEDDPPSQGPPEGPGKPLV